MRRIDTMILTLIGMSGTGKSHWSKKLAKEGFIRFCCDDLIEELLGTDLKKLGFAGIADVSKWMGQPYNKQYPKTSKAYLKREMQVMNRLLKEVKKNNKKNIVIDTTGSVIYTESEILKPLEKLTKVIYLETPQSVQDEMFRLYIKDPKPVIWGDVFNKKRGESDIDALARCYPKLLQTRSNKYKKLAHKKLDYHTLRAPLYSVADFLAAVKTP